MRCDALVGYAWCRSSYTAIRSLSRLGLRVAAADSTRFGMGQCSRYAAARFVHADPQADPDQFLRDLRRILRQCRAHFYLPGHDEGEIAARHRDRLPANVILPLADAQRLALANDKLRTTELAESLGVPVPRRMVWETPVDLADAVRHLGAPVVVKLRRGCGAKGVFYASSPEEAAQTVRDVIAQYQLTAERHPIVQQRVYAEGWGVSCLYWEGQRIASFTHRRLREKTITGGTSTLRASARNPAMEAYAHRLLDHLRWHGLAMVEFKWDPAARQAWFLEINPRLWGSIALPVACGVDFPALMYIAATQGADEARRRVCRYREGVVARWYLGDLILGANLLARRRFRAALRQFLPGGEDVYDDLLWDDPGATIAEFLSYLVRFLKQRSTNPVDRGILG